MLEKEMGFCNPSWPNLFPEAGPCARSRIGENSGITWALMEGIASLNLLFVKFLFHKMCDMCIDMEL